VCARASHERFLPYQIFCHHHQQQAAVGAALLRARYRVRLLIESNAFNQAFLFAIIANTAILAAEHDGMAPAVERALGQANLAFTALFIAEAALKVAGLGPWGYARDPWNVFDGAVVALSVLELSLTTGPGLSALRCAMGTSGLMR
jgi:hypothetical protein